MSRIKSLLAALAALAVTFSVAAQDVNAVIDKYEAAAALVNEKKFAEAIPALNETIAAGQEVGADAAEVVMNAQKLLPACYLRVGASYAQKNDWDNAIENFTKSAELGELYGDTNSEKRAKEMIGRAYTAQGGSAFNDKDYEKASEIFAKGFAADPTNTGLGLNLAMSYAEAGNLEKAYEVYDQIMSLTHSKYADDVAKARERKGYYQTLGIRAMIDDGNYEEANTAMETALEADPENPVLNMLYIQAGNNNKKWDRVIARGEAAAAAQPTDELKSDVYFFLAVAYQSKGNTAKALENYRKVTAGNYAAMAKEQVASLSN